MIEANAPLWFLIASLPVALWVAWSDMSSMKIPNKAVLALFFIYVLLGPIVLPLDEYGLRFVHLVVVLVLGFVMSSAGLMGAGDAKFAAAMAPFIALADIANVLYLFAAILLAAFFTHRAFRQITVVRERFPDWESWTRQDFPMGLALSGTLIFYLALSAFGRG